MSASEIDVVLDLERRRCASIEGQDFEALSDCLAEDYLHVYGGGDTSGKADYIKKVTEGPRAPERGELTVRLYGDTAVITGDMINRIRPVGEPERVVNAFVTQVAARLQGRWRFVSFQITQKRK